MKRARDAYPEKYQAAVKRRKASQAKKQAMAIRRADLKFTDHGAGSENVTSSGTITSILTNLVRGDNGLDNFSGRSILVRGITLKWHMVTNQTYNRCRVMLFQWLDSGTPTLSGLLASTTTGIATVAPIFATNRDNVNVLYDKHFVIAPTAAGDTTVYGEGSISGQCFIPSNRVRKVKYNTGSNTPQHGNIFLLTLSDDAVTFFPLITYHVRTSFYDS